MTKSQIATATRNARIALVAEMAANATDERIAKMAGSQALILKNSKGGEAKRIAAIWVAEANKRNISTTARFDLVGVVYTV